MFLLKQQRDDELHSVRSDYAYRPQQQPYHHPNCVFNALTTGSGYESDSSYIIKKKDSSKGMTNCRNGDSLG